MRSCGYKVRHHMDDRYSKQNSRFFAYLGNFTGIGRDIDLLRMVGITMLPLLVMIWNGLRILGPFTNSALI